MVAKGVIVASATDTVRRAPLDPRVAAPLVPVANRPILFHALEGMREAGIADVAIVACPPRRPTSAARSATVRRWGLQADPPRGDGGGPAAPLHAAQAFVEDGPFILQRGDGLLGDALSSFAGLLDEDRPRRRSCSSIASSRGGAAPSSRAGACCARPASTSCPA